MNGKHKETNDNLYEKEMLKSNIPFYIEKSDMLQ